MVTLPKEGNIKDKVILILPQKPFALYQVDYNGNCINGSGRYDAIGWLHNFAPYNELADGLAWYGYLVIRMDMLGACGKEDFTNYEDGVLEWVTYVTELFHIKNDLVVIGHRENNIQAVKLMLKERWKVGILLCCEPHGGYDAEGKSCLDYMLELGKEHSVLQINAGIGGKRKNKIRETDKLKCKYKSVNVENMDISLRKGKSRNRKIREGEMGKRKTGGKSRMGKTGGERAEGGKERKNGKEETGRQSGSGDTEGEDREGNGRRGERKKRRSRGRYREGKGNMEVCARGERDAL